MKPFVMLGLFCALTLPHVSYSSDGRTQANDEELPRATIDSTRTFDVTSRNGETYRIKVYTPREKPPKDGYPSIYVLDGNVLFSSFVAAMRNRSQARELKPTVIIGIESGEGSKGADRTYDFTATDLTPYEKTVVVDLGPNPPYGGYDAFYRTIETDIKTRVGAIVPLDPHHRALFGWSLGGWFVLHTMFTHPEAFQTYVALSPSIWRTDRAVLKQVPDFERHVADGKQSVRLYLGVGGDEDIVPPSVRKWNLDQAKMLKEVQYARMKGNTVDLDRTLQPFFVAHHLDYAFKVYDGETHNSVPWTALNPVLTFTSSEDP
jgi:predicted alpha/beta superfamily hydrolase